MVYEYFSNPETFVYDLSFRSKLLISNKHLLNINNLLFNFHVIIFIDSFVENKILLQGKNISKGYNFPYSVGLCKSLNT